MTPTSRAHVAVYIRTVTEKVKEETAVATDLAADRGWSVADVFEDVTTSKSRRRRTGFIKLMKMLSTRKIQVLIISRPSDIFFSAEQALQVLAGFATAGVRVVCTRTDFDSSSLYSGFDLATLVLDAVAETSVERRVMAMGTAIQRGLRIGRPRVRVDAEAVRGLLAKGVALRQVAHDVRVGYGTVQRLHAAQRSLGSARAYPSKT